MAEKGSPKRSTQTPDTSIKAKRFPLELVKVLQNQFEVASSEYPGLTHGLMIWPQTKADTHVREEYIGIRNFCSAYHAGDTLCQVWQDGPGIRYKAGFEMTHFLCRGLEQSWSKPKAIRRFFNLAYSAGCIFADPSFAPCFSLSDERRRLMNPIEWWLFALHESNQAMTVDSPLDIANIIIDLTQTLWAKKLLFDREFHYFGIIYDTCIASSLRYARFWDDLTGRARKKRQRPPLPDNDIAVLELLENLPERKGLTGRQIFQMLDEKKIYVDQSTLTKSIIPRLRRNGYNVKNNRNGAGYYIKS